MKCHDTRQLRYKLLIKTNHVIIHDFLHAFLLFSILNFVEDASLPLSHSISNPKRTIVIFSLLKVYVLPDKRVEAKIN